MPSLPFCQMERSVLGSHTLHWPVPLAKVRPGNLHGNKLIMNGAVVTMVMAACSLSSSSPLFSMNQSDLAGLGLQVGKDGGGFSEKGSRLRKREVGLKLQGNRGLLGCHCHGDRAAAC